jgi:hypothetical protein
MRSLRVRAGRLPALQVLCPPGGKAKPFRTSSGEAAGERGDDLWHQIAFQSHTQGQDARQLRRAGDYVGENEHEFDPFPMGHVNSVCNVLYQVRGKKAERFI